MRIVLLGCPGAGKGTQSKILSERYGFPHIATGDLFRAEITAGSVLGLQVAGYLKSGTLVPDAVVVEMVAGKLQGCPDGFLLDGFPRTLEQAQALDKLLRQEGSQIDMVMHLHMREEEVVRRLTGRRSCSSCGALYNVVSHLPRVDGKCDHCGADLIQRDDDGSAIVRKRLMVYEDLTRPLVAYYRAANVFRELDGGRPVEEVTLALMAVIDGARVRS